MSRDYRFAFWMDRFLKEMQATGRGITTIANYRRKLRYFSDFAGEQRCANDVRAVGADFIKSYRRHLDKNAELSLENKMRMLLTIKIFFAWLAIEGVILLDLASKITLPKMPWRKLPPYLSQQDARAFIEAATPATPQGLRDRAILETLYSTGMRVSELCRLQIADLNFADGVVRILSGKGKKDRMVPIGRMALHYMDRYMKEVRGPGSGGPLFRRMGTTEAIRTQRLYIYMDSYRKKAGIKIKVYPHLLRHSFAVHLLENGADIRHIQAMLGHEQLSTTQLYTQVVPLQLKKAHAAAHPAEKQSEKLPANAQPKRRRSWLK